MKELSLEPSRTKQRVQHLRLNAIFLENLQFDKIYSYFSLVIINTCLSNLFNLDKDSIIIFFYFNSLLSGWEPYHQIMFIKLYYVVYSMFLSTPKTPIYKKLFRLSFTQDLTLMLGMLPLTTNLKIGHLYNHEARPRYSLL